MFRTGMIAFGSALAALLAVTWQAAAQQVREYALEVLPAEHQRTTDLETGAELVFLTSNPSRDTNLYFHERSWLADSSLILFNSGRDGGGLMGYLTETGELVRIATPEGPVGGATAAGKRNSVFALQGAEVLELALAIDISSSPGSAPSKVTATEKCIATLPPAQGRTSLNESPDEQWLSIGARSPEDGGGPAIYIIHVDTGDVRELCRLPDPPGYASHVIWSRTNPHLISFASGTATSSDFAGPYLPDTRQDDYVNRRQRIWVVDIRDGVPRNVYHALEGELVTHESWWVNDQLLFCGGTRNTVGTLSHVKALDVHTGQVRIVGEGYWWPDGTAAEIAKWNWWHASGSENGRWVAGDNWHGDIMLFEGDTARPHLLTQGHRTYGSGDHPHVGWDRKGEQVVFTSHKLGSPDVCVATVPEHLQRLADSNTSGLAGAAAD